MSRRAPSQALRDFLQDSQKEDTMFCTGASGIGKKYLLQQTCREMGVRFKIIHLEETSCWNFLNMKSFSDLSILEAVVVRVTSASVGEISKVLHYLVEHPTPTRIIFVRTCDGKIDAVHRTLQKHCSSTLWVYPMYTHEIQALLQRELNCPKIPQVVVERFHGNIMKALTTLRFECRFHGPRGIWQTQNVSDEISSMKKRLQRIFGGSADQNITQFASIDSIREHLLQNLWNMNNLDDICKIQELFLSHPLEHGQLYSKDINIGITEAGILSIAREQRTQNKILGRACHQCGGELRVHIAKKNRRIYRRCIACERSVFEDYNMNLDLYSKNATLSFPRETTVSSYLPKFRTEGIRFRPEKLLDFSRKRKRVEHHSGYFRVI